MELLFIKTVSDKLLLVPVIIGEGEETGIGMEYKNRLFKKIKLKK